MLLALRASASQFCEAEGVAAVNGVVRLVRRWDRTIDESFETDLAAWQVLNYNENLTLSLSKQHPHGGAQCLSMAFRPDGKDTDTAWEMRSPPFPVAPGSRVRLRFWRRHNISLSAIHGHGKRYWSRVQWLDAKGEEAGHVPIMFGDTTEEWRLCTVEAEAPAGATQVGVRLGFDAPNLGQGEHLGLDDLVLLTRSDAAGYVASGDFTSRPMRVPAGSGRSLTWTATVPPNASLKLQVRCASDRDGGHGKWSEFLGPDGPGSSFNASPAKLPDQCRSKTWIQYRSLFATRSPQDTPVLEAVRIGSGDDGATDRAWTGLDDAPPVLAEYRPTRSADPRTPLVFRVADDGVGVDPRTVRMQLDGTDVAPQHRDDGSFVYTPDRPLEPSPTLLGFRGWSTRNYRRRLVIRKGKPRTQAGAETLMVTRLAGDVDTAFAVMSPEVPVQGGAEYVLSYWVRTDLDLRHVDRRASRGLIWYGSDGGPLGEPIPLDYGDVDVEWHQIQRRLVAPAQAEHAVVSLGWDSPNIANRHFVELADVQLLGPRPRRAHTPNLHHVRVTAADWAGNQMERDWYILIKEPPQQGIVTVRDDGVTLIDGEPFFPIGIYSVSKRESNGHSFDRALGELRAAGFNTAHTYMTGRSADFTEFYAAAVKHGMKLYVAPATGTNSPDAYGALATVVKECNESALLAWYLGDDTSSWIGSTELRRVHQAARDIDPYHITTQADGCSKLNDQRYARFVNSTTGFLPELYPIRHKTGNHVASVIRGMENIQAAWRLAGRVTPVWAIIQDFEGWGWARYPTNDEERCMVYLAIIHGAQGITWYTYGYRDDKHGAPWHPDVWAYLKRIAGELASLGHVLTSRDPKQEQKAEVLEGPALGDLDYPSINLRLKRYRGAYYLLAANSSHEPVTARITAPDLGATVEVLYEDRMLASRDGRLQDVFAPLAVHVYKW